MLDVGVSNNGLSQLTGWEVGMDDSRGWSGKRGFDSLGELRVCYVNAGGIWITLISFWMNLDGDEWVRLRWVPVQR